MSRFKLEHRPQIAVRTESKIERQNADDGVAPAVEQKGAADGGRLSVKKLFPEMMTYDDGERATGFSFDRKKRAAEDWFDAQHGEKIGGGGCSGNHLWSAEASQRKPKPG